MIPKEEDLAKAIKEAKSSKKRNFLQSVDLIINLRDIDLNKPENRISEQVTLPNGTGKEIKIALIGGGELARKAKGKVDRIVSKERLKSLADNKKESKKIAREYNFFLAQPELMSDIASRLGPILGPRDKMPEVVPPRSDLDKIIKRLRKTVRIKSKKQPVIHTIIGTEKLEDKKLVENAMAIFKKLRRKVQPRQVGKVFVKLSMGEPIRVR